MEKRAFEQLEGQVGTLKIFISRLNTKGNLPVAIVADEAPTLYIHRVDNLISTARSNKVAVLLGLQELPQLKQLQGKDTATTMTAVETC